MNKLKDLRQRAAKRGLGEMCPGSTQEGAAEAIKRLQEIEWEKSTCPDYDKSKRPKIAAVDFDGTVVRSTHSANLGDPLPGVVGKLHMLREAGWKIVIWTVRRDSPQLRAHLKQHNIPYDYINEHPWQPPDASHKIWADVYIDDKALRFDGVPSTFDEIRSIKPWWK